MGRIVVGLQRQRVISRRGTDARREPYLELPDHRDQYSLFDAKLHVDCGHETLDFLERHALGIGEDKRVRVDCVDGSHLCPVGLTLSFSTMGCCPLIKTPSNVNCDVSLSGT